MTAELHHFPSIRCNECRSLNEDARARFGRADPPDPGPCIPWPVAPFVALGMAAAMLMWSPLAFVIHAGRPE